MATDILERILARKREEIDAACAAEPLDALEARARLAPPPRDFVAAIKAKIAAGRPAVIAEIKRASPSKGLLRADFDAAAIAASYAAGGAACLSVLTDRNFFQGEGAHLALAKDACALPVLRKDFVLEPYQVFESRALGADCILLIAAALAPAQMKALEGIAHGLGMAVLVEVHDRGELEAALALATPLIGINNRDLRSFHTTLDTTLEMLPAIPQGKIVVTESGIRGPQDVSLMASNGVRAMLVGEALMAAPDPGKALEYLIRQ